MVKTWWLAGLAVTALAYGACSKDDAGDDGGAGKTAVAGTGGVGSGGVSTSGTGSGGRAGQGGSAGAAAGPAITSAPPAWTRPADCGGIGNLCPNLSGCAEKSTCQLEGNVCIPKFPDGASSLPGRTAETPYCAAYTCMTFDEASCFCTGEAGKTVPACSSPPALAGLCVAEKSRCDDKPCCDGLTCTENAGGSKVCQVPCTQGSDCASGCCTDLYDTGVQICAVADACTNPCKSAATPCAIRGAPRWPTTVVAAPACSPRTPTTPVVDRIATSTPIAIRAAASPTPTAPAASAPTRGTACAGSKARLVESAKRLVARARAAPASVTARSPVTPLVTTRGRARPAHASRSPTVAARFATRAAQAAALERVARGQAARASAERAAAVSLAVASSRRAPRANANAAAACPASAKRRNRHLLSDLRRPERLHH